MKKKKLYSDDVLLLEPVKGRIPPKSHMNIKMTLKASIMPSAYEGEIECLVNWIQLAGDETQAGELLVGNDEYLYLRIKKQPVLENVTKVGGELATDEPLLEGVLTGMLKEILDDPCLDEMAKRVQEQPTALYPEIDNDLPPDITYLSSKLVEDEKAVEDLFADYIKESNACDVKELDRKMLFLNQDYVRFTESIFDNTLFNIIQEATHGECDLMKAPRTYISKKPA